MSGSTMPTARDIAGRLQLARRPRAWRGACPACSYPDAFAVKDAPNGGARLFCANGCDRAALDDTMRRLFAGTWRPIEAVAAPGDVKAREATQAAALRLWAGSGPVAVTLAERYLQARGIADLVGAASLRFRADCSHPDERGRHPAMVALVQRADGAPIAAHRTYLDRQTGRKAGFLPAKASLGPVWGGAIRLEAPRAGVPLVIGEGIESAASAGLMTGWPAWAAISAGNLERGLQLPPGIQDIAIAVDPDPPGESAARGAAARWKGEGRQVRLLRPIGGGDFNDALLRSGVGADA